MWIIASLLHYLVKFLLLLLNLIFTIFGLTISVAAISLYIKFKDLVPDSGYLGSGLQGLATCIIAVGCITILIAFSGSWGAYKESKCLLVMFAVFMFSFAAAKIYFTIVFVNIESYQTLAKDQLNDSFNKTIVFNFVEATLHCCGTTGPDSYSSPKLPKSCCIEKPSDLETVLNMANKYLNTFSTKPGIDDITCLKENAAKEGCIQVVDDFIALYGQMIRTALISIISVEVLEFIGAVYLCISITLRSNDKNSFNRTK